MFEQVLSALLLSFVVVFFEERQKPQYFEKTYFLTLHLERVAYNVDNDERVTLYKLTII